jgi:hypothetical protein
MIKEAVSDLNAPTSQQATLAAVNLQSILQISYDQYNMKEDYMSHFSTQKFCSVRTRDKLVSTVIVVWIGCFGGCGYYSWQSRNCFLHVMQTGSGPI